MTENNLPHYYPLPPLNWDALDKHSEFVLLETNKYSPENHVSYLFFEPVRIIKASCFSEVSAALENLDAAAGEFYLAGVLAYELGAAWSPGLRKYLPEHCPLLWFGVFNKAVIFDHKTGQFSENVDWLTAEPGAAATHLVSDLRFSITRQKYRKKIAMIKTHIEAGNTYQVNFTARYRFDFKGSPFSLYGDLKEKQFVAYNSLLKFDGNYIISISPELYFRKDGSRMCTKPMKGTFARGRTLYEDGKQAELLATDEKNQCENVMIVDLMRNDLGRISKTGSVTVPQLFTVEKYASLFQMTSTIESQLQGGISWSEIFKSIFPAGSVTGAPKLRTMQIIQELEDEPRGIYTGAIGFTSPGGWASFNVPIRTITLRNDQGEMGVGSGIVYDSDPDAEYDECQLKARFLVEEFQPFSLIETMLWQGGYARLQLHLARLRDSADYFDFNYVAEFVQAELAKLAETLQVGNRYKVRLLLARDGQVQLSFDELSRAGDGVFKVTLSRQQTNSADRFLFHKTTRRNLYDAEHKRCAKQGHFDVIFQNEKGEITEGAISNIFIKKDAFFFTPPVECGLLAGVFREDFLRNNVNVEQRVLHVADLQSADAVYLTNSVRGLTKVQFEL